MAGAADGVPVTTSAIISRQDFHPAMPSRQTRVSGVSTPRMWRLAISSAATGPCCWRWASL